MGRKESESKTLYILDRVSQGATIRQIAEELGMSIPAVQARYRKETRLQLANMTNIVAEVKIMQTQQLGYIYNQAVKSWQLSAKVDVNTGEPTIEGDAKYLDTAMKALKDTRTIWNADQPLDFLPGGGVIPVEEGAEKFGGNIDQVGDVLLILKELGMPGYESLETDQVQELLIPTEMKPPEETPPADEIL